MKTFSVRDGTMPALGLGTWKAAPGEVGAAVREAIGIGYRHIDCAPIYGNEGEIGQALEAAVRAGEARRDELWITSKLWNDSHLPEHVRPALERTLGDLRLDYLDLFLVHWPIAHRPGVGLPEDPDDYLAPEQAPLEDTWTAMEELVDAGLTRHIGVSNFTATKLRRLVAGARILPTANQVEAHPLNAQTDLLDWCRGNGIVMTAYSPLGSPDRPDYLRHEDEPSLLENGLIGDVAAKHGATPAQVLIAWAIQRGSSVIPKSSNPGRLRQNFAAAELALDDEDLVAIGRLDQGFRMIDGGIFCPPGSPYSLEWLWD